MKRELYSLHLRPRRGYMLVSRDPVLRTEGRIVLPDSAKRQSSECFVHIHRAVRVENLTGRRIIIDRLVGRPFTIQNTTFWAIPEGAALAVFETEKEPNMTRDELKQALCDAIDEAVPTNDELDQAAVDDIVDAISPDDIQELSGIDEPVDEPESDPEPAGS